MSRTASRGATLVAPLPQQFLLPAANGDDFGTMLASARTDAEAAAPVSTEAGTQDAATSPQAEPSSREKIPGAAATMEATKGVAASEAAPEARAVADVPAFVGKTATVAQVGKPAVAAQAPSAAGSIGSAVFALVMVVGLILALGWLVRRMPGFRGATGNSALRIVGSLALSPRERVVVVAVGETQLVLGVGTGGTRTLHTLSEPLPLPETSTSPAFAQLLSQHFGKKA